jgi:hypothetical protein
MGPCMKGLLLDETNQNTKIAVINRHLYLIPVFEGKRASISLGIFLPTCKEEGAAVLYCMSQRHIHFRFNEGTCARN